VRHEGPEGKPVGFEKMIEEPTPEDVVVYRCRACGDVFPAAAEAPATCPSCGGDDVARAWEPLL
jgi:rubrerythrin